MGRLRRHEVRPLSKSRHGVVPDPGGGGLLLIVPGALNLDKMVAPPDARGRSRPHFPVPALRVSANVWRIAKETFVRPRARLPLRTGPPDVGPVARAPWGQPAHGAGSTGAHGRRARSARRRDNKCIPRTTGHSGRVPPRVGAWLARPGTMTEIPVLRRKYRDRAGVPRSSREYRPRVPVFRRSTGPGIEP